MRMQGRFLLCCLVGILCVSCAKVATYKERTLIVGYTDRHIFENRYEVTFRGGWGTPNTQVWEWTYRRAAEVTLENGYTYFIVTKEEERYDKIDYSSHLYVSLRIECFKDYPAKKEHTYNVINALDYLKSHVPST